MEHNVLNDTNITFHDELLDDINVYFIDVVLLLSNIFGLIANTVILYVIYKIKSWKVPMYVLISNWAVMDILYLITSPGLLKWYKQIHQIYQDFALMTTYMCLNVAFECGILLILFVLIYIDNIKMFKGNYLKILAFIWLLTGTFCAFAFASIANHIFYVNILFSFALYAILMTVLIITCITFFVKKRYIDEDFKLRLTMVCVYVCFGLAYVITAAMFTMLDNNFFLIKEIALLVFAMGEMNSVANIYILTKLNRTFNIYCYRLFDCRRNKPDDKINIVYEYQPGNDN